MLCTVTGERGGFRMRAAWYERGGPAREVLTVGEMEDPRPGPREVLVRAGLRSQPRGGQEARRLDGLRDRLPARYPPQRRRGCGRGRRRGRLLLPPRRAGVGVGHAKQETLRHRRPVRRPTERTSRPPARRGRLRGRCMPRHPGAHGPPLRLSRRARLGQDRAGVGWGWGGGGFAVSFAKWGGAEVVATIGSEEQAVAALEAGADHTLNYRTDDVAARVWGITEGSGVDRIVEVALGRNLALDAEMIAQLGTIRLVGSDDQPEEAERRAIEDIKAALGAGVLRPRVARRLPLERIAEAHEAIEGGQSGGRVVLDID